MIKLNQKGFSLIELMIVVAIIGILAAIVYPSYTSHIQKSNRGLAQTCLLEYGQYMERIYTTSLTYESAAKGYTTNCQNELADKYDIAVSGALTATTYSLKATPKGSQAGDACGTMSLSQDGTRTDALSGECWK